MSVKRCALCKKPAYSSGRGNGKEYWVCSDCRLKADGTMENEFHFEKTMEPTESICDKCRKRTEGCRFTESHRSKIEACSDWEGKNTERNRRRWAKFDT